MKEVTSSLLPVVVLVIQADKYDWNSIFAGTKLNCGREVDSNALFM